MGNTETPHFFSRCYCHGLRSTILMMLADSLLTKTTISIALAFKGNHASAFGYLAHSISQFIWTRSKLLNSIHLVHFIFCPYGDAFITTNF